MKYCKLVRKNLVWERVCEALVVMATNIVGVHYLEIKCSAMATLRSPSGQEIGASESWQRIINTWSAEHRWKAFHERREHASRYVL